MADLYDLSDEELEKAFREAKEAGAKAPVDPNEPIEEETVELTTDTDEEFTEESDDDSEEEFDNDLEQPEDDEGSDHDSDEDDAEEESDEDASETDEDNPDGESETDEEDATEDTTEEDSKEQGAEKFKVKANGQEFEFTPDEVMQQFPKVFGQAMDYTKKLQAIKPWRKTIDAIEQAELGHEDINLMIDVLSGDKDAIAEVLKRTSVDALDLNTEESNYIAKDYGRDESTLAIKDVLDDISRDKEFEVTQTILTKQWDKASFEKLGEDPKMLKGLHIDVQSGMYDTIAPIANKLKVYDGATRSDLDYYLDASRQYYAELSRADAQAASAKQAEQQRAQEQQNAAKIAEVKQAQTKRAATKKASAKRRAAAPVKTRASSSSVGQIIDDSDEAFAAWYKDTTGRDPE